MAITQTADQLIPDLRILQQRLLLAGGVGALLSLAGWWSTPTQFFQSYLMGYMLVLGITLGCLALGMVHQLSGGAWGVLIRRPIGAAARVLPILTVLFLPIALGMHDLYEWTHADIVAQSEVLRHKQVYLNTPFFLARAAAYFLVWNALSYFLNAWGLEQDRTDDPRIARRMRMLSGGGLVAYGLTISFASFDWLMSLEPHWFSTIYGVLIIGGQGLAAMAFLIIVIVWLSLRPPLQGLVVPALLHDLGNLLLAFVMLWAYLNVSQFIIIYQGNLPEEIPWYINRIQGHWEPIGTLVLIGHFVLPFSLLLSRNLKRKNSTLARIALFILVMRVVDITWTIGPIFRTDGTTIHWLDFALVLALGGLWLPFFFYNLGGRALVPAHDPYFKDSMAHAAGH